MRRIISTLAGLLVSASLFAQVQTVITGKVNNKPDKPVILLVYFLDTTNLQEEEYQYQAKILGDNTFSFVTDKIGRPFTFCRIGFDNEGMKLRISPGDSLHTEFTCGAMDSTITFAGRSAAINHYLKQLELATRKNAGETYNFLKNASDSTLALYLTGLRDRKVELLNLADSAGQLDPVFVTMERKRIDCEYFNSLMGQDVREVLGDSIRNGLVRSVLQQIRPDDEKALLDLREYRNFIRNYIEYNLEGSSLRRLTVQDYLNRANLDLSGWVLTWYSYNRIIQVINRTRDPRDKVLLRDYFIEHSPDFRLTRLLKSCKVEITPENFRDTTGNLLSTFAYLMFVFLLVAIIALIILGFRYTGRRWFPGKPLVALFWGILALLTMLAGIYLSADVYPGNRLVPVQRAFTLLGFLMINSLYLIPVWFRKQRYIWFFLLLFVVSLVYIYVLVELGDRQLLSQRGTPWLRNHSSIFIAVSWLGLIFLSFILHFLNLAIRTGKRLADLLRGNRISLEVIFNILLVSVLFIHALIQNPEPREGRNNLLILLIGTAIFYLHAIWLVPACLKDPKILKYLGRAALLLIPTFLIFYATDRFFLHRSLSDMGLRVSWAEVIRLPNPYLLKTVLILQLVMVPAWLYAWIKVQLNQKTTGFKLFRNKEAEFNQLRAQVNPHFLFNSLNTLYAFALKENNSKTAEYIAKLANLMRYLLDDMQKEKIPVKSEISYIRDYINLQSLRSSVEHRIGIIDTIGEDENLMIAPMLMIPFVENAFKHGINPNNPSELAVNFQLKDDQFQFVIDNSVDKNFEAFYKEKGFGIGIENVRQRLAHIYPGNHTLSVADTGDRFIVILTIALVLNGPVSR